MLFALVCVVVIYLLSHQLSQDESNNRISLRRDRNWRAYSTMNNTTVVSNATGTETTTEIDIPDMDIGFNIYYYGLLFSLTLINIPANILVITTILRHRQLRQPANYFLASLAVSDLVMGCVCPVYNLSHLEIPAISGSLGKYSVAHY